MEEIKKCSFCENDTDELDPEFNACADCADVVDDYDADIVRAYIEIVGVKYFKPEDVREAYFGEYESDADFAEDMARQTCEIDFNNLSWPLTCIDWEQASRDLMYDYTEQGGYYFRNL